MTDKVWPCAHSKVVVMNEGKMQTVENVGECPICGARKPEEPRKLRDIFAIKAIGHPPTMDSSTEFYQGLAEEAVRAFEEVIDEVMDASTTTGPECVLLKSIKQKLRELL